MRKILYSTATLAVLAVAVTPWIFGVVTQRSVEHLIASMPIVPELSVRIKEYQRGWRSSKVTLEVVARDLEHPAQPDTVQFTGTIQHGPVISTHDQQGHSQHVWARAYFQHQWTLAGENQQLVRPFIGDQAPVQITGLIPFDGHIELQFTTAEASFSSPDPQEHVLFKLAPIVAQVRYSPDFRTIQSSLRIPPLHYQDDSYEVSSEALQADTQLEQQEGVWLGQQEWKLAQVRASEMGRNRFTLKDLKLKLELKLEQNAKDQLHVHNQLSIGELSTEPFSFKNLAFQFNIQQLNFSALKQLEKELQQVAQVQAGQAQTEATLGATPLQAQTQANMEAQMQARLVPYVVKLLSQGAGIDQQLQLDMPEGHVMINSKWTFANTATANDLEQYFADTHFITEMQLPQVVAEALLTAFFIDELAQTLNAQNHDAQAKGHPSQRLTLAQLDSVGRQQALAKLAELAKQGYLQLEQGSYKVSLQYDGKQTTLNGKTWTDTLGSTAHTASNPALSNNPVLSNPALGGRAVVPAPAAAPSGAASGTSNGDATVAPQKGAANDVGPDEQSPARIPYKL